ncbi:hypothetical protein V8E36_009910 [Tilletia maclaganii]
MTFNTARATIRASCNGRREEGHGNGLGLARAQDAQRLRSASLGSRSSVASSDPAARIHAPRSSPLRRTSVPTSLSSPAPASKHLPAPPSSTHPSTDTPLPSLPLRATSGTTPTSTSRTTPLRSSPVSGRPSSPAQHLLGGRDGHTTATLATERMLRAWTEARSQRLRRLGREGTRRAASFDIALDRVRSAWSAVRDIDSRLCSSGRAARSLRLVIEATDQPSTSTLSSLPASTIAFIASRHIRIHPSITQSPLLLHQHAATRAYPHQAPLMRHYASASTLTLDHHDQHTAAASTLPTQLSCLLSLFSTLNSHYRSMTPSGSPDPHRDPIVVGAAQKKAEEQVNEAKALLTSDQFTSYIKARNHGFAHDAAIQHAHSIKQVALTTSTIPATQAASTSTSSANPISTSAPSAPSTQAAMPSIATTQSQSPISAAAVATKASTPFEILFLTSTTLA